MLLEQLQKLGFTKNEAAVYAAMLDLGETKVGPIIQRTGFHRNIIYRALDVLIAKRFVYRVTKRGVFHYGSAGPDPLVEEASQRVALAKEVAKELAQAHVRAPKEAFILTGNQGIDDVFNLVVETGEDYYLIGANAAIYLKDRERFMRFDAKRAAKGIVRWHLSIEQTRGTGFNELPNTHARYLPPEFSSPLVIWIFGSSVVHGIWEEPATFFLMKDQRVADDYRKYFRLLWKTVGIRSKKI
jgi:predicted transcriptional regulator